MKKTFKSILAILLTVSMLMGATAVVFAAEEVYLSDLRLIYAESFEKAKQSLANSKLVGYQVLDENLNSGTGKNGVWLAYKTTTNIDDAITDISTIQMGGGYNEGNYQQMIQQSKNEYLAMGEIYMQAIDYFAEAYEAGDFLAESAYRQLNVYAGVDLYADDRLGDLFIEGALTASDLATLFMQGNAYVLRNVRSLLAMGVSYNEEGLHYLNKVSLLASGTYNGFVRDEFAEVTAEDIGVVADGDDLNVLAAMIAPTLTTFRNMFEELSSYEAELNFEDEEYTELEIKYAEYKALAEMMRVVDYLDGQSLYDFCMNYTVDTNDYSSLYPLVNALNEGQIALTKVGHFYDVVRYSMSDTPETVISEKLDELEAKFAKEPFGVYAGVDRSIYSGTFALTSAAYRADAYTDSVSLMEALFGNGAWKMTSLQIASGAVGIGLFVWAIKRSVKKSGSSAPVEIVSNASENASNAFERAVANATKDLGSEHFYSVDDNIFAVVNPFPEETFDEFLTRMVARHTKDTYNTMGEKIEYLNKLTRQGTKIGSDLDVKRLDYVTQKYNSAVSSVNNDPLLDAESATASAMKSSTWGTRLFTGALYIAGALSMAYSAMSLYKQIHDYYHPTYDVIPEAMVDLIKTADGDRYIKYDVVTEITMKDGAYPAGDLNAFSAQRWNALYYTKNYEAGKPLLADFVLSKVNNRPEEGYLAVHRFGEEICYDLNKYNFSKDSDSLFLSIRQSENQKTVVAEVPTIIGSLFGNGILFLAGGVGLAFGIGGTVGLQSILKKKKKGSDGEKATA